MYVGGQRFGIELLERGDVVEYPDRPPMRAQDQVVLAWMDDDVVHGHSGQIHLERGPIRAAVKGNVGAVLGAGKQQARVARVLAHHVHRAAAGGDAARNRFPRLAVVGGHEEVHVEVVAAVTVKCHVGGPFRIARGCHAAHVGALGHARHALRDIFPGLAGVAGHLQVAVVGAHPEHRGRQRRFADCRDARILLHAVVARERILVGRFAHDGQLIALDTGGQVAAQLRPGVAAVCGLKKEVPAVVNRPRVVRRNDDGGVPLEAVTRLALFLHRADIARLVGAQVAPHHIAVLRFGVNCCRFGGIDLRVETIPTVHAVPVFVGDALLEPGRARPAPTAVVLQAAADVVRPAHVCAKLVELPERHRVDVFPSASAIIAPVNAAVAARDHVAGIRGVDPHGVIIAMDARHAIGDERLPPILGVIHRRAHHPDAQVVVGIDYDLAVVGGARIGVRHLLPTLAFVLAAEDAALRVLHDGINDVGVAAINADANAADVAALRVRQPLGEFLPGGAAVGALVDRAGRPAAVEAVGRAATLVGGRIECVGALRIHRQVHYARVLIDEKRLRPSLTAVSGLVNATLLVWTPQVPQRRYVHHVRVGGMNRDAADVMRVPEPHVRPRFPGVSGLIDPVAPRRALPVVRLARAHPHDRWVRGRHRHIPDGRDPLVVKHRLPRGAGVGGLPDAARGCAHVHRAGIGLDHGEIVDSPAHDGRAQLAPLQVL